jgi:hypothetical protein
LTWRLGAPALVAAWLLSSAGTYAQTPSPGAQAPSPGAQAPTPGAQAPSPGAANHPADISDQKLDAAAAAIQRVASLKQDYEQRISAASPPDKQRISDEAMSAIAKAVVDQGLSIEEYVSILDLAQTDAGVHEKIIQRIRPGGQ